MELSNEKIVTMMETHKERLEKKKELYHSVHKYDPEFVRKNRERAKRHFDNNKEKKRQYYYDNIERKRLNNFYYSYKRQDRLEDLKKKHPKIYDKLIEIGKIQE